MKLLLVESRALKSGIQLEESGILLRIGIQNPSPTDKDWNQVPGIRNPRRWNPESKTSPCGRGTKLSSCALPFLAAYTVYYAVQDESVNETLEYEH